MKYKSYLRDTTSPRKLEKSFDCILLEHFLSWGESTGKRNLKVPMCVIFLIFFYTIKSSGLSIMHVNYTCFCRLGCYLHLKHHQWYPAEHSMMDLVQKLLIWLCLIVSLWIYFLHLYYLILFAMHLTPFGSVSKITTLLYTHFHQSYLWKVQISTKNEAGGKILLNF